MIYNILSDNYDLLVQQKSILDNHFGYPINSTLEYTTITKHHTQNRWFINIFESELDLVILELKPFINGNVPSDWFPPTY